MDDYKKRIADNLLKEKLERKGAVLIEGPKWCGKTTTAEKQANSILYMTNSKSYKENLLLEDTSPDILLKGNTPRLIDEWQVAPKLWDTVRFEVDHRKGFGHFILTGASTPIDTSYITHSGTGRFSYLKMRTMSLLESGESSGEVSLSKIFSNDNNIYGNTSNTLEDIAYYICRGGWTLSTYLSGKSALNQAKDYYDAIVNVDMSRVDNVRRDPEKVKE